MPLRPSITTERTCVAKRDRSLPAAIEAIVKAAHHLVGSEDPAVRGVGEALATWLENGAATPLDTQLGLRRRGGVSAARLLQLAERDAMLRLLWQGHGEWAGLQPLPASRKMQDAFARYEAGRWLRERHSPDAPPAEPYTTFWRILRADMTVPKMDRLCEILSAGIQYPV